MVGNSRNSDSKKCRSRLVKAPGVDYYEDTVIAKKLEMAGSCINPRFSNGSLIPRISWALVLDFTPNQGIKALARTKGLFDNVCPTKIEEIVKFNKNQRQRIVVFAGSPVRRDKAELEVIGKKLKKSSVANHVVSFGDEDMGKHEKILALVVAVNNDNSHIVDVPPSGKNCPLRCAH